MGRGKQLILMHEYCSRKECICYGCYAVKKRSVVAVIQVSHHLHFAAGSKPYAAICKLSCFVEEHELRAFENKGRDGSGNVLD